MELLIKTPRAFVPLLAPRRFKGACGGRGAAKSHFVAERLIEDCVAGHERVACVREFQSSIKDSVKQLLEDKIQGFALGPAFRVTDTEIRGPNDSLFVFKGLQGHTAESIKSLEGFTRLWVEEAQTISQRSLDLAVPTFRRGSELWFTWNPKKPSDPVDRLFGENSGDADFACVRVTYRDNPWFPDELRRDMERDRRRDPDKYAHIWMGDYERKSEARVFRNWRIEAFETPPDARFYFGADWGFSVDPTVLVRCWLRDRTIYVDAEAYMVGCSIDRTPALFDRVEGSRKWPVRADSARPETIEYMNRHGFTKIEPALKGPNSVADGIEFLKSYDIVVHPRCVHTADELSFYSYKTDRLTNEVIPVLDDKKNHVIDSLRYAVEGVRHTKTLKITPAIINRFGPPRGMYPPGFR
jgi:phage terminase large subunit